jgi:hypothetical protein
MFSGPLISRFFSRKAVASATVSHCTVLCCNTTSSSQRIVFFLQADADLAPLSEKDAKARAAEEKKKKKAEEKAARPKFRIARG